MQTFDKQRSRGLQGFGLFDGQEKNIVREVNEDGILKWLVKYDSNLILFHHRFPTSTANVKRAAHPFATKKFFGKKQYVLVHNGSISNSKELRVEHEKMGIKYQSITDDGRFNDSEALLWDFALTMEGRQDVMKARGGIAFICIQMYKGKLEKLLFGRNSNPLNMQITEAGVRLSSEGKGDSIQPNQLYTFTYKTNHLSREEFDIPSYYRAPSTTNSGFHSAHSPSNGYHAQHWNYQNQQYGKTEPVKQYEFGKTISVGRSGDWLPRHLRQKYAQLLAKLDLDRLPIIGDDREVIDYDRDGNPLYASDLTPSAAETFENFDHYWMVKHNKQTQNNKLLPSQLTPEQQEEKELVTVDEEDVYQLAFEYMIEAEGNFEDAYFLAENDYSMMFDTPVELQDDEYLSQVRIMEEVMQLINSDPEYIDEHSVSSTWTPSSAWSQQPNKLVAA